MKALKIHITKFISNDQPGFVECLFTDALGKTHTIHEKIPVVTAKDLDENSLYPQEEFIACEIIKQVKNDHGQTIVTISTDKPWGINTIEQLSEFDVQEDQLTDH